MSAPPPFPVCSTLSSPFPFLLSLCALHQQMGYEHANLQTVAREEEIYLPLDPIRHRDTEIKLVLQSRPDPNGIRLPSISPEEARRLSLIPALESSTRFSASTVSPHSKLHELFRHEEGPVEPKAHSIARYIVVWVPLPEIEATAASLESTQEFAAS